MHALRGLHLVLDVITVIMAMAVAYWAHGALASEINSG